MNKEIICINSHPTIESHVKATVKTFKEAEKLDVDTMYVFHHHEIPEYINKNADHVYVDKRNEIIGFNTLKKYDYLCRPIDEHSWFTGEKGDVIPTNSYAHYLNIKTSIQIARVLGYEYVYILVHDVDNFFYEKNFDKSFYPMQNNIKNHDMVFYPQVIDYINTSSKNKNSNILSTSLFAINANCEAAKTFFNMNTIDEYSKIHEKWSPWLKNRFKTGYFGTNNSPTPLYYPCTYLEMVFALEFHDKNIHICKDYLPGGTCGFFHSLIGQETPKHLKGKEVSEFQNVSKWRKKLDVVRT